MATFVAIDSQGEDVEIIALGRELERLEKRCLALFLEGKDEESEHLLPPIMALDSRISDTPAKTLAGIAVKLRIAANADDLLPFNPDEKYYSFDQLALLSALDDVERMAKGAEQ